MKTVLLLTAFILTGCPLDGSEKNSNDGKKKIVERMYQDYKAKSFAQTPDLSPKESWALAQKSPSDVVIVDVREAKERAVSHVPGSISEKEYLAQKEELKGKTILAYCTIGYRSGLFIKKIRESGIDGFNISGSLLSWTHANLPLVDSNGKPTKKAHVYGEKWDLLPDGYISTY